MKIEFISSINDFKLDGEDKIKFWINSVVERENKRIGELQFIFVNNDEIKKINKEFLNHDYLTDVITFDKSFLDIISGEIYICVETVYDNARQFSKDSILRELYRVIIHGVLHLLGFNDINNEEQKLMRNKEDYLLSYLEEL